MNPDTVKKDKKRGEPIFYGDASHEALLHHAHLHKARAVAIMINDVHALKQIVTVVRKLAPELYLIVRVRYLKEVQELKNLGADEVIPDELGSSIEVLT